MRWSTVSPFVSMAPDAATALAARFCARAAVIGQTSIVVPESAATASGAEMAKGG